LSKITPELLAEFKKQIADEDEEISAKKKDKDAKPEEETITDQSV